MDLLGRKSSCWLMGLKTLLGGFGDIADYGYSAFAVTKQFVGLLLVGRQWFLNR